MAQKQFIIDGGFVTNADSAITGNLEMTGNILPSADITYDLGSPTAQWKDIYVGPGSLYVNGQKVLEDNSGTIVVQADADQSMTVKTAGTGVLTLQSEQTVNFAATLQMAAGKKITDASGNAVVFGDKIDMDNNQIINIAAPTEAGHAANKTYVDNLIANISTDAITEGDTEIEIADLGTGTIGFSVDGSQRLALGASAAAFTVPVTVNGRTLASEAYADQAEADAKTYTDARETAITTAYEAADSTLQSNINTEKSRIDAIMAASSANADTFAEVVALVNSVDATNDSVLAGEIANRTAANTALSGRLDTIEGAGEGSVAKAEADAKAYTDTRETAITTAYRSYADTAEADAISSANDYTDVRETAITTAYRSYADQAEADAKAYTNTRETAITTAYQSYADTAEADAKSYTDTREGRITIAYESYADQAEADAKTYANNAVNAATSSITSAYGSADSTVASNAAADATSKANTAEANAKSYADTRIANVINGAPGALDTLNELAAALGDDANFASTVTSELNSIKSAAISNITTFHARGANFTDAEAAGTAARTFAELDNAAHYDVYLNRVLLRGPETGVDAEYSVSGTTITFVSGVVSSSDNIEIRGFKASTIS